MLKEGDKTQLKSGGPMMTVTGIDEGRPNYIRCHWFDGYHLKSDNFVRWALADFPNEKIQGPHTIIGAVDTKKDQGSSKPGDPWNGKPTNPLDRGSLHFFLDEEGDLTVCRWGWEDTGGESFWQTLGNGGDASPSELLYYGWIYLCPVTSKLELFSRPDVVERLFKQVLPERIRKGLPGGGK